MAVLLTESFQLFFSCSCLYTCDVRKGSFWTKVVYSEYLTLFLLWVIMLSFIEVFKLFKTQKNSSLNGVRLTENEENKPCMEDILHLPLSAFLVSYIPLYIRTCIVFFTIIIFKAIAILSPCQLQGKRHKE